MRAERMRLVRVKEREREREGGGGRERVTLTFHMDANSTSPTSQPRQIFNQTNKRGGEVRSWAVPQICTDLYVGTLDLCVGTLQWYTPASTRHNVPLHT